LNYLAHAYLSFGSPAFLAGNMISDFVKGKKKFDFIPEIQKGIALHRAIDDYTDSHPVTKEAKQLFRPAYGLYAGAFMDIVYDHFLANDTNQFASPQTLDAFAQATYHQLTILHEQLPEKFQRFFYYMKTQNWLYTIRLKKGIANSFEGLVKRAAFMHESLPAISVLEEQYDALGGYYQAFFPGLKQFAHEKWLDLSRI
jgi:acyl carrier protein phosphodiesterase